MMGSSHLSITSSRLPPPAAGRTRTGSGRRRRRLSPGRPRKRDPPRTANFFRRRLTPRLRPPRPSRPRLCPASSRGLLPSPPFAALASAAAAAARPPSPRRRATPRERRQRRRSDARQADHGEGGAGPGPSRRAPLRVSVLVFRREGRRGIRGESLSRGSPTASIGSMGSSPAASLAAAAASAAALGARRRRLRARGRL